MNFNKKKSNSQQRKKQYFQFHSRTGQCNYNGFNLVPCITFEIWNWGWPGCDCGAWLHPAESYVDVSVLSLLAVAHLDPCDCEVGAGQVGLPTTAPSCPGAPRTYRHVIPPVTVLRPLLERSIIFYELGWWRNMT